MLKSSLEWTYSFQHGNSALHEAAWNGYSRTLEVLVKNKARVNIVNKAGFTPLHLSAQNGHNQSARVLLYASCNPDAKNNVSVTSVSCANLWLLAMYHRILTKSSLAVENNQSKYLLNILLKCRLLCVKSKVCLQDSFLCKDCLSGHRNSKYKNDMVMNPLSYLYNENSCALRHFYFEIVTRLSDFDNRDWTSADILLINVMHM